MPKAKMIIELVEEHFKKDMVMTIEDWEDILIELKRRIEEKNDN